jgi:hypothetical protein
MLTCGAWRTGFLTNHARVLLCTAHDPGVRVRDIAPVSSAIRRLVASPEPCRPYVARVSACPPSEEILLTARSS